jgi:ATP/maltotriose-dependent transcriptional regulator MalT
LEEARALVGPLLEEIAGSSGDDETPVSQLVLLLQAAVALDHRRAASALIARLECVAHLSSFVTFQTCIARDLGEAAALSGDRAAARAYMQALESAGKIRFRPELALTHLRLAELLLEHADDTARSEAAEHLAVAIPEFQEMHMQPALERALALRDDQGASPEPQSARPTGAETLTAREREISSLVADGLSNHEIAQRSGWLSPRAPLKCTSSTS